jgi:hypothetical protein
MGIPYQRFLSSGGKEVSVVMTGMLSHPYYVRQLMKQNPFLRDLRADASDVLAEIVRLADADGRGVFALRDRDAPQGYTPVPTGITWQWVRAGTPIGAEQVAARLFSFCTQWPDELDSHNPARHMAFYIREWEFLWPFTSVVQSFPAPQMRRELLEAVARVRRGEVKEARQRCRQGLDDFGLPLLVGPRPYPTSS